MLGSDFPFPCNSNKTRSVVLPSYNDSKEPCGGDDLIDASIALSIHEQTIFQTFTRDVWLDQSEISEFFDLIRE